jgi:hypothetical protein
VLVIGSAICLFVFGSLEAHIIRGFAFKGNLAVFIVVDLVIADIVVRQISEIKHPAEIEKFAAIDGFGDDHAIGLVDIFIFGIEDIVCFPFWFFIRQAV